MSSAPGRHRLFVGKDTHKFSSAHMSLFPDGTKERLHGHNFRVSLALELTRASPMVDLGQLKTALSAQCTAWDQRLLLPRASPRFRLQSLDAESCVFTLDDKRYTVPADEVLLLPLENVVVEGLAELFAQELLPRLRAFVPADSACALEVSVTESEHQGATFRLDLPLPSPAD